MTTKAQLTQYLFKVNPLAPPRIIRNGLTYECAEKFRLNSNKDYTDVWLLYKSLKDNSTLKLTIFSRIRVSKLDDDLYDNLMANDITCAWKYAFDKEFLRRNGVLMEPKLEYEIEGPSLDEVLQDNARSIQLVLKSDFNLPLRSHLVVKKLLSVSTSQLQHIVSDNIIIPNKDLNSLFGYEQTVDIHADKFRLFMNNREAKKLSQ